jgi:PAS domain S-box-containing protein
MKPEHGRARIPGTAGILWLIVALALVLMIAVLTARNWVNYRSGADRVLVIRQVSEGATSLLSALKDAETGQRGFLLTGQETYLVPYRSALQEIPKAFAQLDQATRIDSRQARRVASLKPLVRAKLQELEQTIGLRRAKGAEAALAEVMSGRGMAHMDQIRQACKELQAEEFLALTRERADTRASVQRVGFISVGGSTVLFILLAWSVITIHRSTRRRQELIAALQESEEQTRQNRDWLHTTLQSIGDGVIATDSSGHVVFLNGVAQSLTGWTSEEAVGILLGQVFAITNEKTGATVENPLVVALRENRVVGLANHTTLTSRDGRKTPIDDTAAPIRNGQGEVVGGVLVFRDVVERRRAEIFETGVKERYRFLAEASQELSSSLDYQQTLQRVAGLAVPGLADYCMVDLLEEGKIHPVAHAHVDPMKDALLVEKRRRFPLRIGSNIRLPRCSGRGTRSLVRQCQTMHWSRWQKTRSISPSCAAWLLARRLSCP